MSRRIGMITIGQSPRPDLVAPFAELWPDLELVEAGALDGLTVATLPPDAGRGLSSDVGRGFPLRTRLRDGTSVTLDEATLAPLVQAAVDRVEARGVIATLLLCAGPFPTVRGARPLVRPFDLAVAILRAAGVVDVGVVVPVEAQRAAAERTFAAAGFQPVVWVASIEHATDALPAWLREAEGRGRPIGHVVIDYVGHAPAEVAMLQRAVRQVAPATVLDLGLVAAAALAASV